MVTGAGSGIGRAVALQLAREGWTVALLGRRRAALAETQALAGECAASLHAFPCDLAKPEAVAECEKFRPHVMLLDVHMPEAESGAFCAFVRNSDDLQMTKIIGMSNRLTDGQIAQLVGRGYDSVLRKPFTVRQVIEAIEHAHALVA